MQTRTSESSRTSLSANCYQGTVSSSRGTQGLQLLKNDCFFFFELCFLLVYPIHCLSWCTPPGRSRLPDASGSLLVEASLWPAALREVDAATRGPSSGQSHPGRTRRQVWGVVEILVLVLRRLGLWSYSNDFSLVDIGI